MLESACPAPPAVRPPSLPLSRLLRLAAVLALALMASGARAQPVSAPGDWRPAMLLHASQLDYVSPGSGQRYRIFVGVPATAPPPQGYPVLYVLDGNATFPVAALINRNVDRRAAVSGVGPALVVGVGYAGDDDFHVAARARDYTPAADGVAPGEGGADHFLDFLERELKPLIEASHPVDRQRQAIFGHSYGGLLVLHALFTRGASFSTYLAASPSIWWNDKFVLSQLPEMLVRSAQWPVLPQVMISAGELEDRLPRGKLTPQMIALRDKRPMLAEARALAATLAAQPRWHDRVSFHQLPSENHGSAWLPALSRGFELFLN